MNRTTIFFITLFSMPFITGIYGIIHDQITYTISEEYYTKFKFIQFGLLQQYEIAAFAFPRLQVAIVGFKATWWTGLIIGINIAITALMIKDPHHMFRALKRSVVIIFLIVFFFGLAGLFAGYFLNEDLFFLPTGVNNKRTFVMVGAMHTFSYAGGLTGLISALICLFKQRRKPKRVI